MRTSSLLAAAMVFTATITCGLVPVLAASGNDRIAEPGKKAEALATWPEGVLAIVNDPVRTTGWHPWFSELPNDLRYYILQAKKPEDIERLVRLLSLVKGTGMQIVLDPNQGAAHAENAPATLSIGHQPTLGDWYARLPVTAAGVKEFGELRLTKLPAASPPTLTLYIGHPAFDLAKLRVPANITITTHFRTTDEAHQAAWKAIDEFIARERPETK
jgi:hypothetical protein